MNQKIEKPLLGNLSLIIASIIWGSAFVAQSAGMEHIGPYTFGCIRMLIGGISLLPVAFITGKIQKPADPPKKRTLWLGGLLCGCILFAASTAQQVGIQDSTAGKAGFITALYIVLVPIISLFLKKKVSPLVWVSVAIALVGLYLLCINGDFSIGRGDLLLLLCAVFFSFHILAVDRISPHVNGVALSCIQFLIAGGISIIPMLLFEKPDLSSILSSAVPILYAGVLSCGVAYTLQIIGQKYVRPTTAALIMSMESVVAALSGWLILHETFSVKEFFGCVLMFAAIILAQFPLKKKVL